MAEPQAAPPAPRCPQCGGDNFITQLRKVLVDVGWKLTQVYAVAPCQMCAKCGKLTVTINADIGEIAGLVPDPDMVAAAAEPKKTGSKKGSKKTSGKKTGGKKGASKRG